MLMRNKYITGNGCYNICLTVLFVFFTLLVNATNYYVSNSGNDSNPGTSERLPWKTISKINASTFKAGDSILFKRENTWREEFTIPSGGTTENYIIYGSYGSGDKPRILGSEIERAWTNVSGNIWESDHTFTDPYAINKYHGNIFFIGANGSVSWGRVKKKNTSACVTEFDWTWANNHIYIYSPTDPNTRYLGVEISQRFRGVALNAKPYITFDNLEIVYASGYGIHDNIEANISGLIVKNCHIHHLNIKGNHGYGISVARSNTLFQSNEIHNCGRRAISLHAYGANGFTYENHIAEYNTFYDCFHTTGVDIGVATSDNTHWSNITIRYNYFYHNPMPHAIDGVEVIGSGFMYCGQEGAGSINNVYIYNNIYKNTISRAFDIGNISGPTNMYIWNNVFYGVDPNITTGSTYFILIQDQSDVNFRNNIFYNDADINHTTNFSVMGIVADAGKVTLDNNLYYNTSAKRLMIWYGTSYPVSQWEIYKTVSGQDAKSILGENPLFVSSTDYHLQENSPAIDAGVDVGLTKDLEGNPIINTPDIGAYEWQKKNTDSLTKNTTEDISICEGSSYQGWTTSGQHQRTLAAASGADSIVTTNLTVYPAYHVSEDITIFEGDSYQGWYESGQYERTLTASTGCDSIVTTNLVVENISPTFSEYSFEEAHGTTVIDSKGSNDGTIINEGIRGVGIDGNGLEFTGSGYINLGQSFGDNVKDAVTVSAWINPGATRGNYQAIIWHEGPIYETFSLYIMPDTKKIGFSTFGITPSWFSAGANNLFDGNWNHLAATYNGSEKVIYLDGIAIANINVTGTIESGQGYDLLIGSSIVSGSPTYLYDGLIDEVRIYNYALTSLEIGDLYNSIKTSEVKYTTENISIEQAISTLTQSIYLEKGWNIFSTYLIPSNLNMEHLLEDLQTQNQLIEVQDENGNTYQKSENGWENNIGEMKTTEGYKIRVANSCILRIQGDSVILPINIELKAGWNIISFPYNGSVDALRLLQPLIDDGILEKVQDEKGNSIENWGNLMGWVNEIGNFTDGEGYLAQVNKSGVLPILQESKKSGLLLENELKTAYFKVNYHGNGSSHMNINIIGLNETNLQIGDEIAAFDGDICVGAVKLNDINLKNNAVSIRTSVAEEDTKNGFIAGDSIKLRIWNAFNKEEVNYLKHIFDGKFIYQKHESVFVRIEEEKMYELNNPTTSLKFNMYPNPASKKVTLKFSYLPDPGISILLSDLTGKFWIKHEVNSLFENLDVQTLPSGVYFVKIESGENYSIKKLIIN